MGGGVSNVLGVSREGVDILDPSPDGGGGVRVGEVSLLSQLLRGAEYLLVLPVRWLRSPLVVYWGMSVAPLLN